MGYKPHSGRTRDVLETLLNQGGTSPEQLALKLEAVPPPRPELKELWTPDDIFTNAIQDGDGFQSKFKEDGRVEWKSARIDPKDLVDYFSMWANTQPSGGVIAVGLEKDGTVSGCLRVGLERVLEFERAAVEQCPDARFESRRVGVRRADGAADFLLVFRVHFREDKLVETVRGEAFLRSTDRKRRILDDEKREIKISRGQIAFEKEPVLLNYPEDFDDLLINDFCKFYSEKRGLAGRHSREQILALNHLGKLHRGLFRPNIACALLFAIDPREVMPGARLRFMRFEGTEEKSGQDYNVVKDLFIEGPLPRLIQEAEIIVAGQIRDFTRLGKDGKFYTRPEYPSDVWLEAVVNACVHRSYNFRSMNIFVKMFDDRLVVESPGGFVPPVTADTVYDHHSPRNPHLVNCLYYFDYVKCAHEGTNRMRSMMLEASLPVPEFSQKEVGMHQVHVVLRNNIAARKEFVDAGALKIIGEAAYALLSQDEKQVINYLAERGAISVTEANRLLHRDWATAKKILEGLVHKTFLMRRSKTNRTRDSQARYALRGKQRG